MSRISVRLAVASALAAAHSAHAQTSTTPPAQLPSVVVTGNPLGSELFELVTPVSVLEGPALFQQRRSTLGEMVGELPGISATGFGPNASRPVIRGMEGDRIRMLENGNGMMDASSVSPDHAVALDPLVVDRVEVVRGPAALLYGGNAMGGVVNVIDNRVPQSAVQGITGRGEFRYGGAESEKSTAAVVEAGNGRFALHADAFTRDTDDLRIPGFARSALRRANEPLAAGQREASGRLPNSAARAEGGALGGSYTFDTGYLGASVSNYSSSYGTVAEPNVTIDMQSTTWNVAGEKRELAGFITGLKFRLGHTDYDHVEKESGIPGTTFRNRGNEARIEAMHGRVGPFKGAFGAQFTRSDFSASGNEAFVPTSNTDVRGLFAYEEAALGRWKFTLGGRYEQNDVSSRGGGPTDASTGRARFGAADTRQFDAMSGSLGAVYALSPQLSLAANGAYTERAPTFYELYANGPHAATGSYEVGNRSFGKEKSRALDLALRFKSGPHGASLSAYRSRIDNYLALFNSGNRRGKDGELNPVDANGDGIADGSGDEILRESVYRAVPARFSGFEAEGRVRLSERDGTLDLHLRADAVRATDESTGTPLPRIAPRRYGVGLAYEKSAFGARIDALFVARQGRVSANELPTDAYTLVNATLSYRLKAQQGVTWETFLRGVNLLNEEARNHVSFVKDIAPLGRRSAIVGLRGRF